MSSYAVVDIKNNEVKMLEEFLKGVVALENKLSDDPEPYLGRKEKRFLGIKYKVTFDVAEICKIDPFHGRYLDWVDVNSFGSEEKFMPTLVREFFTLKDILSLRKAGQPLHLTAQDARVLNQWRKHMEKYNEQ